MKLTKQHSLHSIVLVIVALYVSLLFLEAPMKQGSTVGVLLFIAGILALGYTLLIRKHLPRMVLRNILIVSVSVQVALAFITFGHNDIFRYLWDGKVLLAGFNPFYYAPDALIQAGSVAQPWYWEHLFFTWSTTSYPPVLQVIFAMSNIIAQDSLVVLKLIFVLFNAGTLALLYRLVSADKYHWLVFVALNPLFVYEAIGAGHTEVVLMFFLILSVWCMRRGSAAATGMALAGAVLTKVIPVLAIPFFFTRRNWWKVSLAVLVSGAVLTVPFLTGFPLEELITSPLLYAQEWVMSPGLFALAESVIADTRLVKYIMWGIAVLIMLFLWRQNTYTPEEKTSILLLWILISSAAVFSWYWLWVVPFIPLVSSRIRTVIVAGTLMFPLQSLVMYFDVADNTIKYTQNGELLWLQLLLWVPVAGALLYGLNTYYTQKDVRL